jgi:transposase
MLHKYELAVGIDVAKSELCACIGCEIVAFPNNPAGISKLLTAISNVYQNARITCEATGSCQDLLVRICLEKGFPNSQCDTSQIMHYIMFIGQGAKTDKLDAQDIASFAVHRSPATLGKEWIKQLDLRELKRRLDFLIRQCAQYKASFESS